MWHNYSFWVDEFSTARFARNILTYGLGVFNKKDIIVEHHNITTYFIVAAFFKLFKESEFFARLPFVIVGSIIPIVVYFLTKKIFDKTSAICASLLTTFSYFMITWSRQAREFALLQALVLLTLYIYLEITSHKERNILSIFLFLAVGVVGLLTHAMFYLLVFAILIHYALENKESLLNLVKKKQFWIVFILTLSSSVLLLWQQGIFGFFKSSQFGANNLWYYHSFLWREYGLITFLGLSGLVIGIINIKKGSSLLLIHFIIQLLFVCFIWGHYLSKYLLPVFPYLFIGMGYFISFVSKKALYNKSESVKFIVPILLTLFIIANGNKFVIKPKSYYSINHDFREIANIDYNEIYNIIKTKGDVSKQKTAVIETWPDRAYWYIGNQYPAVYFFRWENEKGIVSGHAKKTDFYYNNEGEKEIIKNLRFIGRLPDLKKAMIRYPKGFIFIDDSTLPHDVITYAQTHFKKELYLDHYPLEENPYSIWPSTLYSWGME